MKEDAVIADAALISIRVKKELDFPGWYQQVLTKGDMLEYYDVSGCYILKASYRLAYKESNIGANVQFALAMVLWDLGANSEYGTTESTKTKKY